MKVLVIGGGGREHAICSSVKKSKKVTKIFCAPGNAGTAGIAENVNISADDLEGLMNFAIDNAIDLTIVGPEAPLTAGIVDLFTENELKIFGPCEDAAQMEGSKIFTKNLLKKNNIPTAEFGEFDSEKPALEYINNNKKYPVVVKADGLAAGKGVIICQNQQEAISAVNDIMVKKEFGEAGSRIVIEEFLEGEEASILAFTDGETIIPLPPSQDHKRIFDNDEGPNTGGMGAYAPTPLIKPDMLEKIEKEILAATVNGLKREGITYRGILYAGLMITKDGPKVLEYNVRFGDPETQVVLPLIKSDIVDVFLACIEGKLNEIELEIHNKSAICVVMAAKGYPGAYEKGREIKGLDSFEGREDVMVFHAGTKKDGNKIVTSGGRVLALTAVDNTIDGAIKKVYDEIGKISFEGAQFRHDIGKRAGKY
ncbi:MAG TPA: phosphoribosylamine--glycine ligase [Candidatus Goldiibacteriota bacterium]|nr:phosphoribosylamine--glycine ligase [Candidatus Goldiibacteriota bacterium]HPN65309.1 phosphoribosylamine--glycine ligase [Candidatus Goldiibacteriota bacterium]HRQ43485.1 phosphoribosylamine--glycine ligase [Candidatus Goldiibacteriota bacterium]